MVGIRVDAGFIEIRFDGDELEMCRKTVPFRPNSEKGNKSRTKKKFQEKNWKSIAAISSNFKEN